MIEAWDYFSRYSYHKKRLVFFLESMRVYRDALVERGWNVCYVPLEKKLSFLEALEENMGKDSSIESFCIEERYLATTLYAYSKEKKYAYTSHPSPLFLEKDEDLDLYFSGKKVLRMQHFYQKMRQKYGILLGKNGQPLGGKWSFDQENRKPLPRSQQVVGRRLPKPSSRHKEVAQLVDRFFPSHPGDTKGAWLPTTRCGALSWLKQFLSDSFLLFGPYEDAISQKDPFLFHSALSPLLNLGLLTPKEVLQEALKAPGIPNNSLEGFVRQILGWREFIHGIDRVHGKKEEESNFFSHERKLASSWYGAETGIPVIDDTIRKVLSHGYCHHIERLMVLSNLMLLCEVHPKEVFRWFMELFVDSAEWVMVPNVYGMGQFSDGGLFATKPYLCGSNYLLKMSDYKKEESYLAIDGLYWRFIERKKEFFRKHPRLNMMVRLLEKMPVSKKKTLFAKGEEFLQKNTR